MYKTSSMQEVHSLSSLIQNILFMFGSQNILTYQEMQVSIHMFEDKIDIFPIFSRDNFIKNNNIRMFKFHKKHNFSIGSLCIGRVIKSIKVFFQCFYILGFSILYLIYMTISTTPYFL